MAINGNEINFPINMLTYKRKDILNLMGKEIYTV